LWCWYGRAVNANKSSLVFPPGTREAKVRFDRINLINGSAAMRGT